MKKLLACVAISVMSAVMASGQGQGQVHFGTGDERPRSGVYAMGKPYVLVARLRQSKEEIKYDLYTKKDPPWVRITVRDAATNEVVESEMLHGFECMMEVPVGGKHYLDVATFEATHYTISAQEGKITIGENGQQTITAHSTAELGGGTAAEAADALVAALEDDHEGTALEERVAAVRMIQNRSNSAEDFYTRYKAYSKQMGWTGEK